MNIINTSQEIPKKNTIPQINLYEDNKSFSNKIEINTNNTNKNKSPIRINILTNMEKFKTFREDKDDLTSSQPINYKKENFSDTKPKKRKKNAENNLVSNNKTIVNFSKKKNITSNKKILNNTINNINHSENQKKTKDFEDEQKIQSDHQRDTKKRSKSKSKQKEFLSDSNLQEKKEKRMNENDLIINYNTNINLKDNEGENKNNQNNNILNISTPVKDYNTTTNSKNKIFSTNNNVNINSSIKTTDIIGNKNEVSISNISNQKNLKSLNKIENPLKRFFLESNNKINKNTANPINLDKDIYIPEKILQEKKNFENYEKYFFYEFSSINSLFNTKKFSENFILNEDQIKEVNYRILTLWIEFVKFYEYEDTFSIEKYNFFYEEKKFLTKNKIYEKISIEILEIPQISEQENYIFCIDYIIAKKLDDLFQNFFIFKNEKFDLVTNSIEGVSLINNEKIWIIYIKIIKEIFNFSFKELFSLFNFSIINDGVDEHILFDFFVKILHEYDESQLEDFDPEEIPEVFVKFYNQNKEMILDILNKEENINKNNIAEISTNDQENFDNTGSFFNDNKLNTEIKESYLLPEENNKIKNNEEIDNIKVNLSKSESENKFNLDPIDLSFKINRDNSNYSSDLGVKEELNNSKKEQIKKKSKETLDKRESFEKKDNDLLNITLDFKSENINSNIVENKENELNLTDKEKENIKNEILLLENENIIYSVNNHDKNFVIEKNEEKKTNENTFNEEEKKNSNKIQNLEEFSENIILSTVKPKKKIEENLTTTQDNNHFFISDQINKQENLIKSNFQDLEINNSSIPDENFNSHKKENPQNNILYLENFSNTPPNTNNRLKRITNNYYKKPHNTDNIEVLAVENPNISNEINFTSENTENVRDKIKILTKNIDGLKKIIEEGDTQMNDLGLQKDYMNFPCKEDLEEYIKNSFMAAGNYQNSGIDTIQITTPREKFISIIKEVSNESEFTNNSRFLDSFGENYTNKFLFSNLKKTEKKNNFNDYNDLFIPNTEAKNLNQNYLKEIIQEILQTELKKNKDSTDTQNNNLCFSNNLKIENNNINFDIITPQKEKKNQKKIKSTENIEDSYPLSDYEKNINIFKINDFNLNTGNNENIIKYCDIVGNNINNKTPGKNWPGCIQKIPMKINKILSENQKKNSVIFLVDPDFRNNRNFAIFEILINEYRSKITKKDNEFIIMPLRKPFATFEEKVNAQKDLEEIRNIFKDNLPYFPYDEDMVNYINSLKNNTGN